MKRVTVSKLQIANAKECVVRLEKYDKALKIIEDLLELARPMGQYNKFPDEFKHEQKKSIDVILRDLKSMRAEAEELASNKADKAYELAEERARQVEMVAK